MDGFIRGFIDLVFEYQGRWYVLDYKSNILGNAYGDYSNEKINECVKDHRYDLQYGLYTLALHRHLRQRLPGYSYDQHFGGALLAFLRGMQGVDAPQSGVHFHRFSEQEINTLDLFYSPSSAA